MSQSPDAACSCRPMTSNVLGLTRRNPECPVHSQDAARFEIDGVGVGDVFRDLDKREAGRTLRVYDLTRRSRSHAYCFTSANRKTKVAISRLTNPRLFERVDPDA